VVSLSKAWHVMQALWERALEKGMVSSHVAPFRFEEGRAEKFWMKSAIGSVAHLCSVWSGVTLI